MLKWLAGALASAHAAGDLLFALERGGPGGGCCRWGAVAAAPPAPRAYVMPGLLKWGYRKVTVQTQRRQRAAPCGSVWSP